MNDMMTYLSVLVTVLSILVTGLICWQIFSLIRLRNFKKKIKLIINNSIQESIKNYNQTVSAIIHLLNGILYLGLHDKDLDLALECFIEALSELENAKNKEPLSGIVEHIEDLLTTEAGLLHLSKKDKCKYIDVCKKHQESKKLIKLIDKLRISQSQLNVHGDNIQGINVDVHK